MSEKKLKIIGPYTPEHPGPFCTRDGRNARIICTDKKGGMPIIGLIEMGSDLEFSAMYTKDGYRHATILPDKSDLMNAEEVPIAREFWVNEYTGGTSGKLHLTEASAKYWSHDSSFIRTIHVREVLPGDGE